MVCEAVRQVCAQVIGNDATVGFAGSQGDFELNVMLPVMARNLLESIRLLAAASRLLADRCVAGLVANAEVCLAYAEGSPSIVTPLNRYLGYDEAASIAKEALATRVDHQGGGARPRPRRLRQADRAAARRGPRRPPDDPPLSAQGRPPLSDFV